MCNAGFVQAGVLKVRELFNDNHKLRSYEELQEKHPGCYSWLEYAGLIRALPKQWKRIMSDVDMEPDDVVFNISILESCKKVSAEVY